jgi:ribosomal protein S18 acetylase RimI-like enzyme
MIRKFKKEDSQRLKEIVSQINLFSEAEKTAAVEMIETAALNGQDFYNIFVYENEDKVLGYHCTGKRTLTEGTYDLYWIVVDPEHQDNNVGRELLRHAEEFVKDENGRWILIETSSKEEMLPTRKFYLRNNYTILSEIKDYYSEGEHLILFGKYIKSK